MVTPMQLCKPSFDYTNNQPDQSNPPNFAPTKKPCGDIAAGYTSITLSGNFTGDQNAPVDLGQNIDVKVVGPDGKTAVVLCASSAGAQGPEKCSKAGAVSGPGTYTLVYDGGGAVTFTGSVDIA
jgi:hypothetical protein